MLATTDIDLGVVAQGPKGDKGEQGNVGPAPTLKIGTVTKLNPDQAPTANLSGGNGTYTLDLGIPQGVQGDGGGRNLLRGTRDFSGDWLYVNDYWTKTGDTYNGLSVIETNGDWYGASQYYPVKQGETYTFSLFARYKSGTGSSGIYVLLNANPENGFTQAQVDNLFSICSLDTDWKKCSITFTVTTDGYIKPRMERTDNNTNTLQVCGYMLEKGTIAHDWQLAPEDIQSGLANGAVSDTSTDFNSLTSEGHYDIRISPSYQGKNGPNEGSWGLLDVKVAGHMVVQTYYGDNNANVYVRNRRDGSTWTAWREITFWPRS